MAVTKRLRFEILRRDNHACRYCGAAAPDATLTVDHVTPTALGGSDDPSNLVAACTDCNSGKSATPADAALVADVANDAFRWREAMRCVREADLAQRDHLIEIEKAVWEFLEPVSRWMPEDWFSDIERFVGNGLDKVEIVDAARIAAAARVTNSARWKYFCGICWKRIHARHATVRDLLNEAKKETPQRGRREPSQQDMYAADVFDHLATVCDRSDA